MKGVLLSLALVSAVVSASVAVADDADVLAIHGDVSRSLFGSGTGVTAISMVVACVDVKRNRWLQAVPFFS